MGLGLEEADAGVELGWDVDVLVFHGEDADEGGIVSCYLCDIGVFPVAKLDSAVASNLGLLFEMSGCSGELVNDAQR